MAEDQPLKLRATAYAGYGSPSEFIDATWPRGLKPAERPIIDAWWDELVPPGVSEFPLEQDEPKQMTHADAVVFSDLRGRAEKHRSLARSALSSAIQKRDQVDHIRDYAIRRHAELTELLALDTEIRGWRNDVASRSASGARARNFPEGSMTLGEYVHTVWGRTDMDLELPDVDRVLDDYLPSMVLEFPSPADSIARGRNHQTAISFNDLQARAEKSRLSTIVALVNAARQATEAGRHISDLDRGRHKRAREEAEKLAVEIEGWRREYRIAKLEEKQESTSQVVREIQAEKILDHWRSDQNGLLRGATALAAGMVAVLAATVGKGLVMGDPFATVALATFLIAILVFAAGLIYAVLMQQAARGHLGDVISDDDRRDGFSAYRQKLDRARLLLMVQLVLVAFLAFGWLWAMYLVMSAVANPTPAPTP